MNPIVEYCGSDAREVAKIVLDYIINSNWGACRCGNIEITSFGSDSCVISLVLYDGLIFDSNIWVNKFDAIEVITGERLRDDVPEYVLKDYIEEKC